MIISYIILGIIGLAAAAFIFFKIKKSVRASDCGSCCGCSKMDCESRISDPPISHQKGSEK